MKITHKTSDETYEVFGTTIAKSRTGNIPMIEFLIENHSSSVMRRRREEKTS